MVLHTWGQNLGQHVHVHCIVTDGGLSPDQQRWLTPPRRGFLFPTAALSKVFRGKYLDALATAHRKGEVHLRGAGEPDEDRAFDCLRTSLQSQDWVVYSKPPFADAGQVLALHSQDRHRQPSADRLRRRTRAVPMARLRRRQPAKGHAAGGRRVHSPLPPACAAARLHPPAPLRVARQSQPIPEACPMPCVAWTTGGRTAEGGNRAGADVVRDRNRLRRVPVLRTRPAATRCHPQTGCRRQRRDRHDDVPASHRRRSPIDAHSAAVDAAPGSGEHWREGHGTHAQPRAKPWLIGSSWQRSAIGRKELTPSVPPEPLLSP